MRRSSHERLSYDKLRKKPITFNRLFGVSVSQFEKILKKVEPVWQKEVINRYKRQGRNHKLTLADMILMTLLYYRSYSSQEFVGCLFNIDNSRVCPLIQRIEPISAKVMAISKRHKLSQEEVEGLIVDATEQPIERPKKKQKSYYSGKKKRHTLKTEIRITPEGRIVHISKSRPGSVHDFTLYKQEPPIWRDTRAFVDSGYQGLDKIHQETDLPYKKAKNKPLDKEEKQYNQALSRIKVKV